LSAIAGCWTIGEGPPARAVCERLLAAQAVYGPDDRGIAGDSEFAAGRCLARLLPEDRFDRQPLTSEDGRFTLVADIRIDNRSEIAAELGLGTGAEALSDAALLLRGCLVWREEVLQRMIGDFAFALWDSRDEMLLLARDTAGERPLHYRQDEHGFAFASMAAALAGLAGRAADVDEERMTCFVADLPPGGQRSFFAGVSVLEPGHCLVARPGNVSVRRYWEPPSRPLRFARQEEYGDALREQLDAAVRRRLRRAGGGVAAQLSSGLDSSAVATSAALALAETGERLLAFTAAPRHGFAGPVIAGRIGDEGPLAAATAALHPNVDHRVVRPSGASALRLLETSQRLAGRPVGHVCNNLWWQGLDREAAAAGARIMLTGEVGNFTISAGLGVDTIADLLRTGAFARWWREALALHRRGEFSWRQLLNASFGPWLPEGLYMRLRGRRPEPPPFVSPSRREAMRHRLETAGWSVRPARDSLARRWTMLRMADPGSFRKRSLAEWGIEERDPTNDRRLVEFCFSLPPEALLRDGIRRPALRRALAGRVPATLLDQRLRGYQMPDWYEQITGDEVAAFARAAAAPGLAGAMIDLGAVEEAAGSWPTSGWAERPIVYRYRMELLRTLAAASFVNAARSGELE
jgi:asparagine synthase (glutamine-hydrolysing)